MKIFESGALSFEETESVKLQCLAEVLFVPHHGPVGNANPFAPLDFKSIGKGEGVESFSAYAGC